MQHTKATQQLNLLRCPGCSTLRLLLAIKDGTVFMLNIGQALVKTRILSYLDSFWPDWRVCVICYIDDQLPERSKQIRYLLGEMPRGQSLPTIQEEEDEALYSFPD